MELEISGNLDILKKEIARIYSTKLEEYRKTEESKFKDNVKKIEEIHNLELDQAKYELKKEEEKVYKTALSEEKLEAKKEFENRREELIEEVFDKALERSREILLSKEYIAMINEWIKGKEIEIEGNFEEYKNNFKEISINSKIRGIIIKEKNKVFDFTYGTFIESRKLDLRNKISRALFENVY